MNATKLVLSAALTAAFALGTAAQAATYNFTYAASDASLAAFGTITTGAAGNVTSITGFVGTHAITGLLGLSDLSTHSTGYFIYDNTVYAGPSLSTPGLLFSVAGDATGQEWNLWGTGGVTGALASAVSGVGYVTETTGALFLATAAVPEPETYALMLAGLGAIGLIARRRKAVTA
jgi:hypothetical protein